MSKNSIGNARRVLKRRIFAKNRQLKVLWREKLAASKVRVAISRAARCSRVKNREISKRFYINNPLKYRTLKSKAAQYMLHGLFAAQKARRGILQEQENVKSWTVCKDLKKQLYRTAMTAGLATGMVLSLGGSDALAMPQDGQIVAGNGTITVDGKTMNISQVTDKMIIDWQKFGISPSEWVNFMQPGANSAALNRVIGVDASQIMGRLSSNGQVFLVNPSGIIFGAGAQVDVGGLIASTMNISNENFLKGNYLFEGGNSYGRIENLGTLNAADKGYIALLAPEVINNGVIRANMGTVLLASGEKITLDFEGDGLLSYAVEPSTIKSVIENHNLIQADGGTVYMSTGAGSKIAESLVTNSGTIKANKIENRAGKVYLVSGGNITNEATGVISAKEGSVTIDAQAALLDKGSVDVSGNSGGMAMLLGDTIDLSKTSAINASGNTGGGTVLVGGDYQGTGTQRHAGTLTVAEGASINADALTSGDGGRVILWSDDTTKFSGNINARGGAVSGNGGLVEVSGKNTLKYDGLVDTQAANGATGNLLLDPSDFTIAASGGDITGARLVGLLATNNITILSDQGTHGGTNGDILVNDNVDYSAGTGNHNLKLSAYHDINFAASKQIRYGGSGVLTLRVDNTGLGTSALADPSSMGMLVFNGTGSGVALSSTAATVVVQYNPSKYSGTSNTPFDTNITGRYTAYMLVNDVGRASPTTSGAGSTGLQAMNQNLSGNYVLGKDIDASATSSWNITGGVAAGWAPVGTRINSDTSFNGKLDGDGHVIDRLFINRPTTDTGVGLFGNVTLGSIDNLGMTESNITGGNYVGGLVGYLNLGSITSSYNTGTVTGRNYVGGLVGNLDSGSMTSSYNTGTVAGKNNYTGGLIGLGNGSNVYYSYNSGAVTGDYDYVGGLVGSGGSTTDHSYNTGAITGGDFTGGLIGSGGSTVTLSYNIGTVTGSGAHTGGLIGSGGGTVEHSYNAGAITGTGSYTGGLIGDGRSTMKYSYNVGAIRGGDVVGGLIGRLAGGATTITDSYNAGKVTATNTTSLVKGGLAGGKKDNTVSLTVTNSFWDTETSGQDHAYSGDTSLDDYGKTTAAMKTQSTFTNWNFGTSEDWVITGGTTYPILAWNAAMLSGSTANPTATTMKQYIGGFKSAAATGAVDKLINTITTDVNGNYSFYIQKGWNSLFTVGSDRALLLGDDHTSGCSNYASNFTANVLTADYNSSLAALRNDYTSAQPLSVSGKNVTLNNLGLTIGANGTFSMDGNITATAGDITLNGNINAATGLDNLKMSSYHDIIFAAGKTLTYGGSGLLTLRTDNMGLGTSALADSSTAGKLVFNGPGSGVVLNNSATAVVQYNPSQYKDTSNTPFDANITAGAYTAYMLVNDVGVASPTESGAGSTGLQAMSQNLAGNYVLGNDIDASATSGWNVTSGVAAGWTPVGTNLNSDTSFNGKLDGDGHVIDQLFINRFTDNVGLFGVTNDAKISMIGLTNGNITGISNVGSLVGSTTGITATTITSSYNNGAVTGSGDAVGGLVGNGGVYMSTSYNTGAVAGRSYTGGLIGRVSGLTAIASSYNVGAVTGSANYVGGLLGYAGVSTNIECSYNAGAVTGDSTGGLIGSVGLTPPTVKNSFWDKDTSGQKHAYNGNISLDSNGITTMGMKRQSIFTGWSFGFDKDWVITDGKVYPVLTWNAALLSGSVGIISSEETPIGQYIGGFKSIARGAAGDKQINVISSDESGGYSFYIQKGWNSLFVASGVTGRPALLLGDDHTGASSDYTADFTANVLTADYNASLAALRNDYTSTQELPLSVSGKNVTLGGFETGAHGTFSMDGNITTTDRDITLNGNINVGTGSDNLKLSSCRDIIFVENKTLTYGGSGILTLRVDNTGRSTSALVNPSVNGKLTFAAGSGVVLNNTATVVVQYNPSKYKDTSNTPFDANITAGKYTAYMLVNDVGAESPTESGVGSTGLQAMNQNLAGNYVLGKGIDASATSSWNIVSGAATGWMPVGMSEGSAAQFAGKFDGDGKVISGLYINRADAGNQGLFASAGVDSVISNLGLTGVNIRALNTSGGLVGANSGTITGSYVKGSVQTSGDDVGGLVGRNSGGNIINSYSRATVTGQSNVGGLVGGLSDGSRGSGSITNCYSTGSVTGTGNTGGLIGINNTTGDSVVTNSFWDTQTSGQTVSAGGTGQTTAQMKQQSTYAVADWDFTNTWRIAAGDNSGYPVLQWQAPSFHTISGILTGWNSKAVDLICQGGTPRTVTTGADGSYSFTNLVSGSYLVYLYDNPASGVAVSTWGGYATLLSDDATLNFSTNSLYADTAIANMGTAIGSYTAAQLPYTYNSAVGITLRQGVTFNTVGNFTLNGDVSSSAAQNYGAGAIAATGARTLSATGGAITLNGAVTADSALTINAGGAVAVNAALSTGKNTLSITAGGAVTQTAAITAGSLVLNGSGASFEFTNAGNDVAVLAGSAKNINYVDKNALAIASITTTSSDVSTTTIGLTGTDGITVETKTMDLTLDAPVTITSGKIVLAAGRNFINSNTADTDIVPGSGQYFVYSSNPANDTRGMTTYSKHYNQNYKVGETPTYASTGNWFLYTVAPELTVAHDAAAMTYGSATPAFTSEISYGNLIDGDTPTAAGITGNAAFSIGGDKSSSQNYVKGSHDVEYNSADSTLASALGYKFVNDESSTLNNKLTVNAKDLQVSGLAAESKVYDTYTTATLSGTATVTPLTGDTVNLTGTAAGEFADKNVGTDKVVTVTGLSLASGGDNDNYNLLQQSGLTANIAKAALLITADDKTKNQNQENPAFTAQYKGLVGSETSSVVSGLQYSTTATQSSLAGTYAINPNSATADNYTIVYKDGVLTVVGSPSPTPPTPPSPTPPRPMPTPTPPTPIDPSSREAKAYESAVETATRNNTPTSNVTVALSTQANIQVVEQAGGNFSGAATGTNGNNLLPASDSSIGVDIKGLGGGVGTKIVQEGGKTFIVGDKTDDANSHIDVNGQQQSNKAGDNASNKSEIKVVESKDENSVSEKAEVQVKEADNKEEASQKAEVTVK